MGLPLRARAPRQRGVPLAPAGSVRRVQGLLHRHAVASVELEPAQAYQLVTRGVPAARVWWVGPIVATVVARVVARVVGGALLRPAAPTVVVVVSYRLLVLRLRDGLVDLPPVGRRGGALHVDPRHRRPPEGLLLVHLGWRRRTALIAHLPRVPAAGDPSGLRLRTRRRPRRAGRLPSHRPPPSVLDVRVRGRPDVALQDPSRPGTAATIHHARGPGALWSIRARA